MSNLVGQEFKESALKMCKAKLSNEEDVEYCMDQITYFLHDKIKFAEKVAVNRLEYIIKERLCGR